MSTLQVRDVSPDVLETLERRAAEGGMSLSAYLRRELTWLAERPTTRELARGVEGRGLTELPVSSADVVREERAERERRVART